MPTCLTCKQEIPLGRGSGRTKRPQKYCSKDCYHNRESEQPPQTMGEALKKYPIYCCQCGKQFVRIRIDQITCSTACCQNRHKKLEMVRERARRLENIRKMIPCKQCHTMFRRKHGSQIHCSKDCSREYSGGINLEMRKKHLQRIKRLVEGAAESKSRDLQ